MQIITIDDADFPSLLEAFKCGKTVGRYWNKGRVQVVCATSQFLLVSHGEDPTKIALKPARGISEAEDFALRLLNRERARGNQVELTDSK